MSYVLARREGEQWIYWTGQVSRYGNPRESVMRSDAFHFRTATAALACAETHEFARNSDVWHLRCLASRRT